MGKVHELGKYTDVSYTQIRFLYANFYGMVGGGGYFLSWVTSVLFSRWAREKSNIDALESAVLEYINSCQKYL